MRKYTAITYGILLAGVALATGAGCAFNKKPEDHAQFFFNKGKENIVTALKKVDADDEQLNKARAILERSEKAVVNDIRDVLHNQRNLFKAVAMGKPQDALLTLESELHRAHERAARSIGKMHEDIGGAVGANTWKAATAFMEEKISQNLRD